MANLARLLFLVLALTASLCLAQVKVQTIYSNVNDDVVLKNVPKTAEQVTSCKIITNNGTEYVLHPAPHGANRPSEYERFYIYKYSKLCEVTVYKMTEKDSGLWTINIAINTTEGIKGNNVSYNIQVRKIDESSQKKQRINVYSGQQVSLHFQDKFSDLLSCKLLSPQHIEYSVDSDKLSKITKSGECGVKMVIKLDHVGRWTLIADLKNNSAIIKSYDIKIYDSKDLVLNRTSFVFQHGRKEVITVGKSMNSRICIFEDPHGKSYSIIDVVLGNECEFEISPVAEYHAGLWKVFYGLEGYQSLVSQEIEVKVIRKENFKSSVTRRNNGDVNLLCQVRGRDMRFCSFVRPDGKMIHMTYGVGDEKYEYYGNRLNIQDFAFNDDDYDCGITIHKPSTEDYGSWKCLFTFKRSQVTGSILKVTPSLDNNNANINTNVTTKNVYVRKGDTFEVKCTSQELLRYCWLRSPNGTLYSISTQPSTSKNVLKYKGAGLDLGECGAEIEGANNSHAGQWTCNLGVNGTIEIYSTFNVTVKDTRLMAAQDMITVPSEGGMDLICQPLPESDQLIEACRWVNPLGYGINIDDSGHYITETKATHCKLSIRAHNENDFGVWHCYARFINAPEEESDQIIVMMASQRLNFSNATLSLILGIILCSSLAVALILLRRLKLRYKQDDEDIILEKPKAFA